MCLLIDIYLLPAQQCKYRLCSDVEFHAWTRCRQLSPVPRNLLKPLIFGYLPSFTPSPDHHALKGKRTQAITRLPLF